MMDGRCATCAYWRPERVMCSPHYDEPFGAWGYCDLAGSNDGKPDVPETKAHAGDAELYGAWLVTQPDFGCVSWEKQG
jgi:hypothetical protein